MKDNLNFINKVFDMILAANDNFRVTAVKHIQ
jgi:hypothetical protein